MQEITKNRVEWAVFFGAFFMFVSILASVVIPFLSLALAISGAGFFVGGAILLYVVESRRPSSETKTPSE